MTEVKHEELDSDADYRRSHLTRGRSYDSVLATAPFDAYMARVEAAFLQRIVPQLFGSERPRHLDFACGTGRITETVAPFSAQSVGVDISASMLEQARRKCPAAEFVEVDLTRADVDLGTFDLVTAFRFFGNAQDDLRAAVLEVFRQVLRPGGYLILNSHRNPLSLATLLNAATGGGSDGMDLHYFKLVSLLRRFGFTLQTTVPIGAWMYRSKLLNTDHDKKRAARLEHRFRFAVLAPIAPDVVVVAKAEGGVPRSDR